MFVEIRGADTALKALRQMEPLTARAVGREVSAVGRMIVAASTAPDVAMRNWSSSGGAGKFPAYRITKPTSRRSGMNVRVTHTSAAGAIYEYAGATHPNGIRPAGRGFINQLPPLTRPSSGPSGRYLRRALVMTYPRAMQQIEKAVQHAVDSVNRLMP